MNSSSSRCGSSHQIPARRSSARLAGVNSDNLCIPNYTKSGVDSVWKSAHEKNSSSVFDAVPLHCANTKCKSLEVPPQVQLHSANSGDPLPKSLHKLGAGFEASHYPYRHGTRASNSNAVYNRSKNERLDLPFANDKKRWTQIDAILSDVLPRKFNAAWIRTTPIHSLATIFDDFLYDFFKENCGTTSICDKASVKKKVFRHRGLENFRRQKQLCKKAFKNLRRQGMAEDSAPILAIKATWLKLMRAHNKLKRAVNHKRRARAKKFAKRQFIKDRVKYAKKLFSGQRKSGAPTFSKEQGEAYFSNLYHDENRSFDFSPLEGMKRPPKPSCSFNVRPPTLQEFRSAMRSKRNGAAPGLNALTYLIYKKCPSILRILHQICCHIYKSKSVPRDWAAAYVVLLQKSEALDVPEEFRPIAITNTAGKLFFSIISDRLQKFMVRNNYIKSNLQKGFLFGVPGCIEHSFALVEALRRVRADKRAIVISWIDLANAYGSVRHNLIQFALNWYHVPEHIQGLIFDYYEKLCASITTKDWSTPFFSFDIGLFQGCVLSTILFDCVFNLLLDFLEPLEVDHAVKVEGDLSCFVKAYADDLQISTDSPDGHQLVLDKANAWLDWTGTMRAKPKKCICMAFRQFRKDAPRSKFVKVDKTIYSVYDPQLSIAGQRMKFILQDTSFKGSFFKFLGRWLCPNLDESAVKRNFLNKLHELSDILENDPIDGFMKLWIYQHFLLGMISWPLLIQDFNHDFVKSRVTRCFGVFLRRWAGLFKSIDAGCLYRRKDRFGLGLTSITTFFEKLQVIKMHILKHSSDPHVAGLYEMRRKREQSQSIWRPTRLLEKVHAMSDFDLKFQHATTGDRRGLGHGIFTQSKVSQSSHRELCTRNVQRLADERHEAHSVGLDLQGSWLSWEQGVFPFDLSWDNVILGPGARIISFVLNATHNSVMTPDLRHICGLVPTDTCKLCIGGNKASLHHIIAGCSFALKDNRYTWRHDSVIATLLQAIQPRLLNHNSRPPTSSKVPGIHSSFVLAGSAPSKNARQSPPNRSLLGTASDWKLLVDFNHKKYLFPPHIFPTQERPDILLYSNSARVVIFGELTCPAEEGIPEAKLYKQARYADLANDIRGMKHPWSVHVLTLEVGARGFVARSTYTFLRKIGFSSRGARATCRRVSEVAARCTYAIYLRHDDKRWSSSRTLVVPRSCKEPILDINPGLRDVSSGVDTADRLLNNSMPMSALSGRGEGDAPLHAWTKSKDSHMG